MQEMSSMSNMLWQKLSEIITVTEYLQPADTRLGVYE